VIILANVVWFLADIQVISLKVGLFATAVVRRLSFVCLSVCNGCIVANGLSLRETFYRNNWLCVLNSSMQNYRHLLQ